MNPVILADNRFLDGTPTATDTAPGYDVLNIRDLKTFTYWKAASFGTKYLTVDCASARAADALGVMAHNLGTAAGAVSVESSATGAWGGEQVERLAPFTPPDDKAILKLFTSASDRYWRLKIVTASVAPKLAVCLLGARIVFPAPPSAPYTPASEKIESESTRSKTGQLLGSIVRFKPYEIKPKWDNIDRTWLEANIEPFWADYASNLKPFFWAWDLSNYPSGVRFVKVSDRYVYDPNVSILARYDSFSLEMEGVKE